HPHLAALETQRDVITLAGHDLGTLTGGTRHRATLADLGLDVVHHGTQRDLRQRHRVADPHVAARTAHHGVTLGETLRVQDVALLAVGVHQQRDARGAVRIVLDLGHAGRDPELVPLEVDPAVHPLVTTTAVTHRELAGVVAAATLLERLQQRLLRRRAGDLVETRDRPEPGSRRDRSELTNAHLSPRTRRATRRPSA